MDEYLNKKTNGEESSEKQTHETIKDTENFVTEDTQEPCQYKQKYEEYDYGQNMENNEDNREAKKKNEGENSQSSNGVAKVFTTILLAIVFGLVAGLTFIGVTKLINQNVNKTEIDTSQDTKVEAKKLTESTSTTVNSEITEVVQNVMPSVVSITSLSVQEVQFLFFGTQQYETESSGSGIIIGQNDEELLIVTNNHVIENNKTLTVTFVDEESVEATVKGTDSNIDIAVIAVSLENIKESTMKEIKLATMGDSDNLLVGEPTIAIGNALGYGQSVTSGIVSALNRELEGFDTKLIQTDAAINPGNSGGALLNIKGEVIGINTVKVSDDAVEGMGYAIPISDVQEIIEILMNKETRTKASEEKRGYLGITGIAVDDSVSTYYNMPEGIYISKVTKNSGAEKAGLTKGSIITKFEGSTVKDLNDLQDALSYYEAGETVEVTIKVPNSKGEYEETTVKVTLGDATTE